MQASFFIIQNKQALMGKAAAFQECLLTLLGLTGKVITQEINPTIIPLLDRGRGGRVSHFGLFLLRIPSQKM